MLSMIRNATRNNNKHGKHNNKSEIILKIADNLENIKKKNDNQGENLQG